MKKMIRTLVAAAGIAAVSGLVAPAAAQPVDDTFTYQGRLVDSGDPANGLFDLEFRVFTAEVGGVQVGPTINRPGVNVVDGLFTQNLNFGDLYSTSKRWLQVRVRPAGVGSFTTLRRQDLLSTPFALQAQEATTALFANDSGTSLDEAYDNGSTINANAGPVNIIGELDMGSPTVQSRIEMFGDLGTFPFFEFFQDGLTGGRINLNDEAGAFLASFESDFAGEGAFMQLVGGDSPFGGLVWDGNAGLDNGGTFRIGGPNSSSFFNTNLTGDGSVALPASSVGSVEMANEPGLATRDDNLAGAALTATNTSLYSRTITAPAPGFVVAICTVEIFIDHVTGSQSNVTIGLATAPDVFQDGIEYTFEYAADNPSDSVVGRIPTIHATFPVSAGDTTIHLNGTYTGAGTGTDTSDIELTLIYIPTAYGSTARPAGRFADAGNVNDQAYAAGPGIIATAADLEAERQVSIADNQARVLAELAAMRARMAEMEAELMQGNDGVAGVDN
jgi:hypothetical protein